VKETTKTVEGTEIVLGDVVKILASPYGWATVVKIEGNDATLFRPYVHIGDFEYTGGVLHYIGTSTFTIALEGRSYEVDEYTHRTMTKKGALA